MSKKFPLTKKIHTHDGECHFLEISEPTAAQMIDHGVPVNSIGQPNWQVLAKYVEDLSQDGIHEAEVRQISSGDFIDLAAFISPMIANEKK